MGHPPVCAIHDITFDPETKLYYFFMIDQENSVKTMTWWNPSDNTHPPTTVGLPLPTLFRQISSWSYAPGVGVIVIGSDSIEFKEIAVWQLVWKKKYSQVSLVKYCSIGDPVHGDAYVEATLGSDGKAFHLFSPATEQLMVFGLAPDFTGNCKQLNNYPVRTKDLNIGRWSRFVALPN